MSLSHDSVIQNFVDQQIGLEDLLLFMYLDSKGLVTTGLGNLLEPISNALVLPWKRPDGSLATPSEVIAEWNKVKFRTDLISPVGGRLFEPVTTLRLTKEDVANLVRQRFALNEEQLVKRYGNYPELPAPAQAGLHSIAWAAGTNARAPELDKAILSNPPDFVKAAKESQFRTLSPKRRAMNRDLFLAAANIQALGADPDQMPAIDTSPMGFDPIAPTPGERTAVLVMGGVLFALAVASGISVVRQSRKGSRKR